MSRYFASLRKAFSALKEASQVWSTRMKQLKFWKWGVVMAVIFFVYLMKSYLDAYAFPEFSLVLPSFLVPILDSATLILLLIYAYGYILKGVTTYLPWYLSLLVTGGLLLFAKFWEPVEVILVDHLLYALPERMGSNFLEIKSSGISIASCLMKLFTFGLICVQMWVVIRLGIGLLREGADFKRSATYLRWSKPAGSFLGIGDVVPRYRQNIGSRLGMGPPAERTEEENSNDSSSDGGSRDDLPPQRSLTKKQKRTKDRARRANRAARRARRANR